MTFLSAAVLSPVMCPSLIATIYSQRVSGEAKKEVDFVLTSSLGSGSATAICTAASASSKREARIFGANMLRVHALSGEACEDEIGGGEEPQCTTGDLRGGLKGEVGGW